MADQGTWDFGVLVGTLADGELRDEATEEIKSTIEQLYERSRGGQKTVKGTITINLDISCTKDGLVTIEPDVKSKLPRKTRRETPLYIGKNGLTPDNPRQQKLFPREVIDRGGEIREPGTRAKGDE